MQANRECPFGDKCRFHHNVAEYFATKPADIGESCYLYDIFGKCAYGLTCRFAKAHTTPDFKTMENAELIKTNEGRNAVKNSLSKDLQNSLRKRSVAFKKSEEYLKTLSNYKDKRDQQGNGKKSYKYESHSFLINPLSKFVLWDTDRRAEISSEKEVSLKWVSVALIGAILVGQHACHLNHLS